MLTKGGTWCVAKRHAGQTDNFFELLSDGNMSLIRAVEKIDFGRGFKFSTYASWAIMKNFARSISDEKHRRERFVRVKSFSGAEGIAMVNSTPPARLLEDQESLHQLREALLHLRPEEKEVFLLRQNGELTYEQIAELRHRPVGTVNTQMRSALQKLRKVLV